LATFSDEGNLAAMQEVFACRMESIEKIGR